MKRIGMTSAGTIIIEISIDDYNALLPRLDVEALYHWQNDFHSKLSSLGLPTRSTTPLIYASRVETTRWIKHELVDCEPHIGQEALFMKNYKLMSFDEWINLVASGVYNARLLFLRNFGYKSLELFVAAAKKYVENK